MLLFAIKRAEFMVSNPAIGREFCDQITSQVSSMQKLCNHFKIYLSEDTFL